MIIQFGDPYTSNQSQINFKPTQHPGVLIFLSLKSWPSSVCYNFEVKKGLNKNTKKEKSKKENNKLNYNVKLMNNVYKGYRARTVVSLEWTFAAQNADAH